jgi:hypothetical protein
MAANWRKSCARGVGSQKDQDGVFNGKALVIDVLIVFDDGPGRIHVAILERGDRIQGSLFDHAAEE